MSGNGRWVDPAPFEGARPRVPWWVLVPGRLRWIAALVALVWLALVGVVRLVLVVVRYSVVTLVPMSAAWCWWRFGLSPLVLALLSLVAALTVWAGYDRASFLRHCWYRLVTEWRRATVYVPKWRSTLGVAGRRVLVSRKWSGKSLADHKHDRVKFVRQLLADVGIKQEERPTRVVWNNVQPGDPNVPPRPHLLLRAVAERRRWKAEYTAALLASAGGQESSATDQAA
jgi:hypothetical protein